MACDLFSKALGIVVAVPLYLVMGAEKTRDILWDKAEESTAYQKAARQAVTEPASGARDHLDGILRQPGLFF